MPLAPMGTQMRTQITKAPFGYIQVFPPIMTLLHILTSHLLLSSWQPLDLVLRLLWNGIWFNNLQFPNALVPGLLVPLSLEMKVPSTTKMSHWTRQDAPFQTCAQSAYCGAQSESLQCWTSVHTCCCQGLKFETKPQGMLHFVPSKGIIHISKWTPHRRIPFLLHFFKPKPHCGCLSSSISARFELPWIRL